MKGFPNQIAELPKLASAIATLVNLVDAGEDAKSYMVFGVALVRAGVLSTGHGKVKKSVKKYLAEQLAKKPARQTIRTTPRGLRELYRLMGLIDDTGPAMIVTELGRHAAAFADQPWDQSQIDFWRAVIRNIEYTDEDGTSHPYQILLRLVARKPGISRAKCALALEAADDSAGELDRISKLADRDEDDIVGRINVSEPNWNNAKKVLPRFAEQLLDVIRRKDHTYVLADAPGRAEDTGPAAATEPRKIGRRKPEAPRAPRSSREVTSETIGMAGIAERSDEVPLPPPGDPVAMAATIKLRTNRLKRHNLLVREFTKLFEKAGVLIYENPFDILVLFEDTGILVETKTLDGSEPDERDRVRDAFGQLLYYEGFLTAAVAGEAPICKIACFETKISESHREWLNSHDVATVWKADGAFVGDQLARDFLGKQLDEFR